MMSRFASLRPTVFALTLAAGLAAAAVYAQEEPRLDVIYVPTPQEVVDRMLTLADVKAGDNMIDFGCGDGRMVVTAAKRGARGYGVDINPQRIKEANANAEARASPTRSSSRSPTCSSRTSSKADVMAMYLLTDINLRLRPKILDTMKPGSRIVSHAFDMGDWKPEVHENVNGRNVYFWIVPAKVGGNLEGRRREQDEGLDLDQKYQFFTGKADIGGKTFDITDGRIKGADISFKMDGKTYTGKVYGDTIAGDNGRPPRRKALRSAPSETSHELGKDAPQGRPSFNSRRAQDNPHDTRQTPALRARRLSVTDGALMMVGIIIGIGIFKTPQIVALQVPNEVWFVGALGAGRRLTTLIGALVYAELAAAYPSTGGEYHFLTRAFGLPVGFLFAWARTTVIQTGAIAAVAFVFGDYAQQIVLARHLRLGDLWRDRRCSCSR